jgi:hypothetical protein
VERTWEQLAAGVCIPPVVIFEGVSIHESHKQNLPAGSNVQITQFGHTNEAAFVEWLQHLKKSHFW